MKGHLLVLCARVNLGSDSGGFQAHFWIHTSDLESKHTACLKKYKEKLNRKNGRTMAVGVFDLINRSLLVVGLVLCL